MKPNSPQVWDSVWNDPGLCHEDELVLVNEAASMRWFHIQSVAHQIFVTLENKKVLEIGSGIGTYCARETALSMD